MQENFIKHDTYLHCQPGNAASFMRGSLSIRAAPPSAKITPFSGLQYIAGTHPRSALQTLVECASVTRRVPVKAFCTGCLYVVCVFFMFFFIHEQLSFVAEIPLLAHNRRVMECTNCMYE